MKEIQELNEQSLQLVVTNEQLGSLTTNAEKIRDFVKNRIGQYDLEHYNADNIAQAKADKALLNKSKKILNDRRKDLEKKFMQPFQGFKDVINETVALIDTAVKGIDSVVKEADEKAKSEKREQIEHIAEEVGVEKVGIKLSLIFNDKWLNKTVSLKKVREEMTASLNKINSDLETLKSFSDDYDVLATRYKENLDLNATVAFANKLKAQREANKDKEPAQHVDATPQTEQPKQEPVSEPAEQPSAPHKVDDAIDAFADALGQGVDEPEKKTLMLQISATKDDCARVIDFLEDNGITFEIK